MTGGAKIPSLAERFVIPPFSVLDARQGYWQKRKRQWLALGIKGEEGRDTDNPGRSFGQDLLRGECSPNSYSSREWVQRKGIKGNCANHSGTSVFDPVLCEVACRWFCPPGGSVLDPFAGESTKGIVASYLGYEYFGIELRAAQVAANRRQARVVGVKPAWICGDSSSLDGLLPAGRRYDLVFTSPPYYDLEVYSRSVQDGSTFATYGRFLEWYGDIFAQAVGRLADDRFLVVKVGEVRDRRGAYRNFVGDNVALFTRLGLAYYNEAILITMVGSLPIRVGRQFGRHRKLGKTHQNVLVFYKGDPRAIRGHFPESPGAVDLPG